MGNLCKCHCEEQAAQLILLLIRVIDLFII